MNLGRQLAASAAFVIIMSVIHAIGVVVLTKGLKLDDKQLRAHRLDVGAFGLLISMALSLFTLHIIEISLFALFYHGMAPMDFDAALYFSASAYTTLGHPEFGFPEEWRLVGAFEGLIGFLLIGWSTAVFVTDMNKLLRD